MGRPRLPKQVAHITGADERSPGRYKDRTEPEVGSLGPAPARLSEAQRVIWDQLRDDLPWLGQSDRHLVELAARIQAQIEDPATETPISLYAQMRLLLSSMGGTPVDRGRVRVGRDDDDDDPAQEFLN
jgi:hypothetical protein